MKIYQPNSRRNTWTSQIGSAVLLLLICASVSRAQSNTSPFPSSGSVGIGTTSPGQKLDVVSNIQVSGQQDPGYWWTSNSGNSSARNWGAFTNYNVFGDWVLNQSNALDGNPYSAGTTRFTIGPSGNVGIGTTNPQQRLSVNYNTSNALPGLSVSETNGAGSAGVTVNNT